MIEDHSNVLIEVQTITINYTCLNFISNVSFSLNNSDEEALLTSHLSSVFLKLVAI